MAAGTCNATPIWRMGSVHKHCIILWYLLLGWTWILANSQTRWSSLLCSCWTEISIVSSMAESIQLGASGSVEMINYLEAYACSSWCALNMSCCQGFALTSCSFGRTLLAATTWTEQGANKENDHRGEHAAHRSVITTSYQVCCSSSYNLQSIRSTLIANPAISLDIMTFVIEICSIWRKLISLFVYKSCKSAEQIVSLVSASFTFENEVDLSLSMMLPRPKCVAQRWAVFWWTVRPICGSEPVEYDSKWREDSVRQRIGWGHHRSSVRLIRWNISLCRLEREFSICMFRKNRMLQF